ncbi:MAG: hypothetical protein U9Q62_10330 [Campylobacterota bacterium]|nr:hypothetical protein [Campylobacterota bacterium]
MIEKKSSDKKWRMTYNRKGITGCSARGVAIRDTKVELESLAETLKARICNVEIKEV